MSHNLPYIDDTRYHPASQAYILAGEDGTVTAEDRQHGAGSPSRAPASSRRPQIGVRDTLEDELTSAGCWRRVRIRWCSWLSFTQHFRYKWRAKIEVQTHTAIIQPRTAVSPQQRQQYATFVTLWPWPLTFWPNIHWRARYRDGSQLWRF